MRYLGLDLTRGIALVGMLVVHAAPLEGTWGMLHWAASERSRMLFAIAAGAGLALLSGAPGKSDPRRHELRRQVAVRALCLLLLGLALTAAGPPISVILDEYGVAFVLTIPFLFASRRMLLVIGITGLVTFPAACVVLATAYASGAPSGVLATPLMIALTQWMFTGSYPVLIWAAAMMTGMAVVRGGLPAKRSLAWWIPGLALFGAGVLGARWLSGDTLPVPVQESLLVSSSAALAVAVLLACIWAGDLALRRVRRFTQVFGSPLAAMGAMPLTMYVLQAVVLLLWQQSGGAVPGTIVLLTTLLSTLSFALVWRRFVRHRGPLEDVIAVLSGRPRRSSSPSTVHPAPGVSSPRRSTMVEVGEAPHPSPNVALPSRRTLRGTTR